MHAVNKEIMPIAEFAIYYFNSFDKVITSNNFGDFRDSKEEAH